MILSGDTIEIVTTLVILLFLIPILINIYKSRLLQNFTIIDLIKTLNKSLIVQLILALCLFPIVWIFKGLSWDYLEGITIEIVYTYIIVEIFMYLPILMIVNLIRLLIKYKK